MTFINDVFMFLLNVRITCITMTYKMFIYVILQNFVVRQSSQTCTMAISVRLPAGKGPYIEHYLIEAGPDGLSLESSDNKFVSIQALVAHYAQCW